MATLNALLASLIISGMQSPSQPLSLNFSQTDVGQIFRAIGLRTGANIVYSGVDKAPITLHMEATSVEEAVRGASASAGLTYRKTGRVYVVAKSDGLQSALEPFYQRSKLVAAGDAADLAKRLQEALPQAKVVASGRYVIVSAIPEDMAAAKDLISDRREELLPVPTTTQVVKLKSADMTKLTQVITTLYPGVKASIVTDDKSGGGTLALSGPEEDVARAAEQTTVLDSASAAPIPDDEFRVYEVHYASANTLKQFLNQALPNVEVLVAPGSRSPGAPSLVPNSYSSLIQGSSGTGSTSGSSTGSASTGSAEQSIPSQIIDETKAADQSGVGGVIDGADRSRKLVLHGEGRYLDNAMTLLSQIDVAPAQVKVDVRVVDVSPDSVKDLGIDWTSFTAGFVDKGKSVSGTNGLGGVTRLTKGFWNFSALLDAMVVERRAKILASPSIQVVDNDDASIFIGDTLRTKLSTSGALGTTTIQIAEFNVGIILLMRPKVNNDGTVTMRIHPVVSTVTDITNGVPNTSSREAETTVAIKDNETMVIGGLIRDEEINRMSGIPILSDLPFLGELFKTRRTEKRKSNVVISLTPHIVRDTDVVPTPPSGEMKP